MSYAIFIRDFSEESEKAQQLLNDNKVDYVEMLSNSNDNEPTLIVRDSNFSYYGYDEISDYTKSISHSSPIIG